MKKTSPPGCYRLRSRIIEISASTQKKTAVNQQIFDADPDHCSQCREEQLALRNEEIEDPCELCLSEITANSSEDNDSVRPQSPSIVPELNAISQPPQPSPSLPAERTSFSDESLHSHSEDSAAEDFDETTPLLRVPKNLKTLFPGEHEEITSHPLSPRNSLPNSSMDTDEISNFHRQMIQLQEQMCKQLEAAHASLEIQPVTESTVIKPALFHGRENENVDRWLQRFALYLSNRKIHPESNQAATQLALHLSGPAESFYYNLPSSVQASYDALKDVLRERFSPAHRHLRLRQALSVRRQGPNESIENFLADLNEKFSCLDLRDEDKLSYLIQGLRADIQADVLKKEPKTYAEAEDTARLIYSIQQSLILRREEDISRLVQNTKLTTTPETARLERLEKNIDKLMSHFEKQPQDTKVTLQSPLETKVAAFKPMLPQTPEAEQLANLQQQFRHLSNMIIGNQSIAAYKPTPRENYHGNSREDEIARLREETHHLKTELKDLKSQKAKEVERYDRTQTSQEMTSALSRALEEIRRMQSRMDGFMRTYATGNHRHHQQQVPIHKGRPLCNICGKIGHVSQYCFHRFQQSQRYWEPLTTQNSRIIPEHEPIIATYEQEASPRIQPSPDQSKNKEQDERVYYARRSQPIPHTLVNTEIPTINTINAVTSSSPNKTKEPNKPQSEFKMPDFDTISPSLQAEDAFVKAHPENDKQEIVV